MSPPFAIACGAVIGALGRYELGRRFNTTAEFPMGTFLANMTGGYLIGFAASWIASRPDLGPEWKLFIITGMLGALTTFSSFSLEAVENIRHGRAYWALALTMAHVLGSFAMTALGLWTFRLLER